MTKKDGRDPGLTVRVPLETLVKLREIAATEAPKNPMLTEDDVLRRLAQRALAIGVESKRLTA